MLFLGVSAGLILFYEAKTDLKQFIYILGMYVGLSVLAKLYSFYSLRSVI